VVTERDEVRFLLGHGQRRLSDLDPAMTLLQYLRRVEGRPGTKEGCAEGDCGACSVVIASPDGAGGLDYQAVNACIRFLPSLDGCQVITVEDLADGVGALHPVQQAMVEENASQCGFCTPGFVMSLFALYRAGAAPGRRAIDDALAGNLCRCTGYGPIIAAAKRPEDMPRPDHFAARAAEVAEVLEAWRREGEGLAVSGAGKRWFAPRRMEELLALREAWPEATLLAGATDVGLWVTKQHRHLETIIYLGAVDALGELRETETAIEIGAMVTYTEAAPLLARHWPDLGELIRRLGAVQVRNVGTFGGNIANGSPIGDSPPPLIVLGAELQLLSKAGPRRLPLEDFFLEYGKQDLKPGEVVEKILLPLPDGETAFGCYKISKRFDQDISSLCAAFALRRAEGRVLDIKIAYGGMAGVPKRATAAEAALAGKPWDEAAVLGAMAALDQDFVPMTDHRASAGYRMTAARNLIMKFYLETSGSGSATIRVLELETAAHG
jgi:xanthine dehydrogenase small subunit